MKNGILIEPGYLIFLVAVATLAYTVGRDWRQRKREFTTRLYERWTSQAYSDMRTAAWRAFIDARRSDPQGAVPVVKLYSAPGAADAIGYVEHFFDDLGRFAREKALDKRLSKAVFKDIADVWRTVFESIDWGHQESSWFHSSLQPNIEALYGFWGSTFQSQPGAIASDVSNASVPMGDEVGLAARVERLERALEALGQPDDEA